VLRRLRAFRTIVVASRPHVIIGFQQGAYFSAAVASIGLGIPVIAAERNAPQRFEHLKDGHGRNFQFQSFRLARQVTVQLESYRAHYPRFLKDKITVIPNPVTGRDCSADPIGLPQTRKKILCVARLSFQKNQSVLIKAFARIAYKFPEWDLLLVGGGEDYEALSLEASRLLPVGRVELVGAKTDVEPYFLSSQLFCLPSRWEGFPNALAEAMSYGLPSVGFEGCAGVNELIVHGETGLLAKGAGDEEELSGALATLMSSPESRQSFGRAARAAVAHFAPENIFKRWEELFVGLGEQR